ncbi:hypothetical protein KAR91_44190 [Candidatus Pacearchaeota archaeon]|nr:hypothetical protein [Candidatus Pacearchaeota archaeon]
MKIWLNDRIGNWWCSSITGKRFRVCFFPLRWNCLVGHLYGSKVLDDKTYSWYIGPFTFMVIVNKNKRERGKPVFHYYFGHLKEYYTRGPGR